MMHYTIQTMLIELLYLNDANGCISLNFKLTHCSLLLYKIVFVPTTRSSKKLIIFISGNANTRRPLSVTPNRFPPFFFARSLARCVSVVSNSLNELLLLRRIDKGLESFLLICIAIAAEKLFDRRNVFFFFF